MSGHVVGANNRLLSDGVYDYEYDAEGNRTAREHIATGKREEYTWDHRNRLVEAYIEEGGSSGDRVIQYSYDAFNRLVQRKEWSTNYVIVHADDTYFYDGDQIVLEFAGDEAADLAQRYVWGPGVDQLLTAETVSSLTAVGDVLWPLTDHLGTTRDLAVYDALLETTTIASHRFFDSFGNLISESNSSVTILFGFTARPFDVETGLQWNLHRWYVSTLGVWMSEDPIGFLGGDSNLGRYVANGPASSRDPQGLQGEQWIFTSFGGEIRRVIITNAAGRTIGVFTGPNALNNALTAARPTFAQYQAIMAQADAARALTTPTAAQGTSCLTSIARGGLYTVLAVEVVVLVTELGLLTYYRVQYYSEQTTFVETTQAFWNRTGKALPRLRS